MSLIRNLHWWTVEYGMIGSVENPKIYGAGLLSSIGESEKLSKRSGQEKIPYSIEAVHVSFDITEMQPQLFVTPNYRHLTKVLNEFADSMALRTGGLSGLNKAIESKNTATAEYSSGLQVSGIFSKLITDDKDEPSISSHLHPPHYAWQDKQLIGHGKSYHQHGFSSPVGN